MTDVLVTGATGTLGQALLRRLRRTGYTVHAASRTPPELSTAADAWVQLDLTDGVDADLMRDIDVVIHAATAPRGDTEAVDVEGTHSLVEAAADADVTNLVYVSIVGIEDIPFEYYRHKLAAEEHVVAGAVDHTIIRSTQFHPFLAQVISTLVPVPIWLIPTRMQVQPVDVGDAADYIIDHATEEAHGRIPPIGGPEVLDARRLVEQYKKTRGIWRPVVRLPIPSKTVDAFRDGKALCDDGVTGSVRWQQYLKETYSTE